jgi:hypothetical protein
MAMKMLTMALTDMMKVVVDAFQAVVVQVQQS